MNTVIISGRLTKDVSCNYSAQSGMAVARFNVALNRGKDKNGQDRGADFPSVIAFGRTAENIEKFSGKGMRISVVGHVHTGSYQNKDGATIYTTEIVADRVEFVDWKQAGQSAGLQEEMPPDGFQAIDEDVPF